MKKSIRKLAAQARDCLSNEERQEKSSQIMERLFLLPEFIASSRIMFFASFRSEVDTLPMIQRALAEGKRVVLPKVQGDDLALFEIRNFETDVSPGTWGIPEPCEKMPVMLDAVDLILVPGLAFDEHGNRLGYGAGFYDKLLAVCSKTTVALAFEVQMISAVPAALHDIPVKKIVTEKRVITAQRATNGE